MSTPRKTTKDLADFAAALQGVGEGGGKPYFILACQYAGEDEGDGKHEIDRCKLAGMDNLSPPHILAILKCVYKMFRDSLDLLAGETGEHELELYKMIRRELEIRRLTDDLKSMAPVELHDAIEKGMAGGPGGEEATPT